MAWIRMIGPDEATGRLHEVYEQVGPTQNARRAFSLRPEMLLANHHLSRLVGFGGSSLGHLREELISLVISAQLSCTY